MTVAVIVGALVLLGGYDVYLVARHEKTISEVLRDAAKRYPIVAFLMGVLVGHWFYGMGCQ